MTEIVGWIGSRCSLEIECWTGIRR